MLIFESRASDYGLMKIDKTGRIVQFSEKPKGVNLEAMVSLFVFVSKKIKIKKSRLVVSSYTTAKTM